MTADFPDLCLQCDLLANTVERTLKTLETQQNLHLVLKELRYLILEIGNCCGRPLDDDDDYTRTDSSAEQIFWEKLQDHVLENQRAAREPQKHPKTPFKAPVPMKAPKTVPVKGPIKAPMKNPEKKKSSQ